MKEKEINLLFEHVRNAPAELSKAQVLDFIGTIPSLPGPKPKWFKNFNLNSIIMTTTAIALVTTLVFYLSSPSPSPEPDAQYTPVIDNTEDSTQIEPSFTMSYSELDTVDDIPVQVETKTTVTFEEPESSEDTVADLVIQTKTTTQPPNVNVMDRYDGGVSNEAVRKELIKSSDPAIQEIDLSGGELRSLKRKITRYLKQDKLYRSGDDFNVLKYTATYLEVNDVKLEGAMFNRYTDLMDEFRISPGPNRRVVTSPKFIQVGDYTDKGFKGSGMGKYMNIYFIDSDEVGLKNLFSIERDQGDDLLRSMRELKSIVSEPGDMILKTQGRVKDAQLNLSALNKLIGGDGDDMQRLFDSGKEAISIFEKGNENSAIELDGRQMRGLKRELYREFINEDLIDNKRSLVRFVMEPKKASVNNQNLEEKFEFRIGRILKKYGLDYALYHKVLMSSDFILVGEFKDGRFSGSVQGELNLEEVRNSMLREDFEGFNVFGFSKFIGN